MTPKPFEPHHSGAFLHGTKADLSPGDLLTPGFRSNYDPERIMNHIYFTQTLDAAAWGAELAAGEAPGRIYIVEPQGAIEDDPNVTDKKFPGNPTRSYRSREAVRVVDELVDWVGHTTEQIQARREALKQLRAVGRSLIED
ncbi:NAD(+)--rifampin ADP-ribosyltransferase [Jongsikchunia kroppenstedtii]|uniref:NAD(+)--rifampin ADP-ribosyltransferase n=1 Tax=Jongsikchunia kroppenstedtii TaxID=1121721 RepID=UPI0004757349|nr:NAD(+)--rifampin ADP-ribosyltransferase [Jongsikchunia kroppenstedtii]